jgi:hypothetical protein
LAGSRLSRSITTGQAACGRERVIRAIDFGNHRFVSPRERIGISVLTAFHHSLAPNGKAVVQVKQKRESITNSGDRRAALSSLQIVI